MNLPHFVIRMRKYFPMMLVLLGAVFAAVSYWGALNYPFILDDSSYIIDNAKLAGLQWPELWRLLVEPYNGASEFLPLRDLSFWFDLTLFGMNPAAFRMHNIVLYLLCLPLVYGATFSLWRYFRPSDTASAPWAAAAVAALFALQPSHVEAVIWISGRKDVLCGMFSLLALWLAVIARREQGISPIVAAATLLALLAAILSKATAVAVAPIISLLWVLFWRDVPVAGRRRSMLLWPLASLLLALCTAIIFASVIKTRVPMYFGTETVTRTLAILGWLTRLSVSPESRHFLYPVFEDPYFSFRVLLGGAALAAAAGGLVAMLRHRSLVGFALVSFTLICIPSLQLIPYAPPSLVSDRFIFLAVWPTALLVVALSWRLRRVPRATLLLVIALMWGWQTMERTRDWRSFEALLDADLRAYPGYSLPVMFKAADQMFNSTNRDEMKTASRISNPEFREMTIGMIQAHDAVAEAGATGDPQNALFLLWKLWLEHKLPPAEAQWNPPVAFIWAWREDNFIIIWNRLLEFFPSEVSVHYNFGLWMLDIGNYANAAVNLRAVIESQSLPESERGAAYHNFGIALLKSGQIAEAEAQLHTALQQSPPELQAHCTLMEIYRQSARPDEAARAEAGCRQAGK